MQVPFKQIYKKKKKSEFLSLYFIVEKKAVAY